MHHIKFKRYVSLIYNAFSISLDEKQRDDVWKRWQSLLFERLVAAGKGFCRS